MTFFNLSFSSTLISYPPEGVPFGSSTPSRIKMTVMHAGTMANHNTCRMSLANQYIIKYRH